MELVTGAGKAPEEAEPAILDFYDRFRRPLNIEYVQQQTIANKKRLEEKDPNLRMKKHQALRATVADPVAHRAFCCVPRSSRLYANVRPQPSEAI